MSNLIPYFFKIICNIIKTFTIKFLNEQIINYELFKKFIILENENSSGSNTTIGNLKWFFFWENSHFSPWLCTSLSHRSLTQDLIQTSPWLYTSVITLVRAVKKNLLSDDVTRWQGVWRVTKTKVKVKNGHFGPRIEKSISSIYC